MNIKTIIAFVALTLMFLEGCASSERSQEVEQYYTNPIIHADYSDPDVCRVGDDFYMTSSSFNCMPGLQILHSTDLVHWEIIGAALEDYPVEGWNDKVQHGNGIWAPAIRHHYGEFYIFCGDPDRGIFMVKARDPRGPWSEPVWLLRGKGFIDPCPLWDDHGKAYLSYACAGSRAGIKSVIFVAPLSLLGEELRGQGRIVYDGHITQPTIEGTKFYKRNGYYYIFAPAGGVSTGWQTVLRSHSPFGPYEERVVMAQGSSPVNGPHQGAWIDTPAGEDWFIHFQDKGVYGRVVHLQPLVWVDNWPVIGIDVDGDGIGEPVLQYRMPVISNNDTSTKDITTFAEEQYETSAQNEKIYRYTDRDCPHPSDTDEFNDFRDGKLGLQWQWQGVPSPYWYYCNAAEGTLRLYSVQQASDYRNLSDSPNLLLQKFPAETFTVTAKLSFVPNPQLEEHGEACGLVVFGKDYSALKLEDTPDGIVLSKVVCNNAMDGSMEVVESSTSVKTFPVFIPVVPYSDEQIMFRHISMLPSYKSADIYLRVEVKPDTIAGFLPVNYGAICTFSYSTDGETFREIGEPFPAVEGAWIGAKVGLFCTRTAEKNDSGWVDVDFFRVEIL